jgi:hypothetical protein
MFARFSGANIDAARRIAIDGLIAAKQKEQKDSPDWL